MFWRYKSTTKQNLIVTIGEYMKTKTYRVKVSLADEATKRATEYVAEERELITESEMIAAAIEKGLKEITDEEISEILNRERNQ